MDAHRSAAASDCTAGYDGSLDLGGDMDPRQAEALSLQDFDPEALRRPVEDGGGIAVLRGGGASGAIERGWNGIRYRVGLSAKNVAAEKLSMNLATIPPGAVAHAHVHVGFEVMLYILQGRVRHEYGDGLRQTVDNEAGDFIFIAPGVPHEVFNLSDTEPVVAVVARSDASEWEHIVPYERPRP
jgi:uncharacterized RmlC-like cupin family protein